MDSKLKDLPNEGNVVHPNRTDRDVLEEILGFVRNQNRSASGLSDDDKKKILEGRVWKAVRSIHGSVGGSGAGPILTGQDLEFRLTTNKGGKQIGDYVIVVPADASPDEMEVRAIARIRETDKTAQT